MKQWTYDKVGNITMSVGERTGSLSHRYGYGYDYDMTYAYDLNGNLAHESVARKRLNGDTTRNISERKLLRNGMNRLKAISENGYVSLYWYDADGNRTVKEHGGGEAVWVNSKHAGTMTDTVTYSIYPNPYININGNRWTKHYYIGGERIASMTGTISGGFEGLNATGNSAITFNAAALSNKTKKYLRLNHKEASIKAIVVEGEILDYLQRNKLNMHA